jgi:hypothetical protein
MPVKEIFGIYSTFQAADEIFVRNFDLKYLGDSEEVMIWIEELYI